MPMFRLVIPLLTIALLAACSGGDAPPAPTITPNAEAADTATASAPVSASSTSTAGTSSTSNPNDAAVSAPPTADSAATNPVVAPPAAAAAPPTATAPGASADPVYTVQCASGASAAEQCQVDKDTYIGWRTFSGQCQVCHGGSALGSTFAPNLLERFHQRVDHARFVEVVTNGFRGQVGAMPAWKGNPNVMPHLDQLYRYLKARADGTLPPGRPERLP